MKSLPLVALSIACIAAASSALAQSPSNRRELVGFVRDSAGAGIQGAAIEVRGQTAATNERGAFQLWTTDIDSATISIHRLGYLPVTAAIAARHGQWDTVVVELELSSVRLSTVTVKSMATRRGNGLRDFEARRAVGNGLFVTRDEITARNTMRPSDVLRGKRGVNLVRIRSGGYGVRFASYSNRRGGCIPSIWIDGQLAPDLEIDEVSASDIEAIEIYETLGSVPFEFSPRGNAAPCGTIAIWTRIPGQP
jgi:hypothetical protein